MADQENDTAIDGDKPGKPTVDEPTEPALNPEDEDTFVVSDERPAETAPPSAESGSQSTDEPPMDGPSGADDDPDLGSSSQGTPGGEHGDPSSGKQSPED